MTDSSRMDSSFRLPPSSLRPGWQIVRFGEVAKEVKATTSDPVADGLEFYVGLEHLDPQSLRIQRKGVIAEDNPTFTRRFKPGQILFGKRRAYQKKAAVADFSGICSGDILVMEAKPGKILPGLLPFIVQSDLFFDWAVKTSSGSLSPRTKWKSLAEFEFPLPPPARQKAILEVLEKSELSIQKGSETVLANGTFLRTFFSESIPQLLHNSVYKQRELLGAGWQVKKLSDLALQVASGTTPSRSRSEYYSDATIPWVKTLDLNEGAIVSTEESVSIKALDVPSLRVFPQGTVLVAMYGGFNQIGRTGILKIEATTNQALCAVLVNQDFISPEYLHLWLRVNVKYWKKVAASSRKDPNLTKTDVKNMPVCYPSLSAQKKLLQLVEQSEQVAHQLRVNIKNTARAQRQILSNWITQS